ncbi:hypothetical protein D3C86_1081890 [compost metagenome]
MNNAKLLLDHSYDLSNKHILKRIKKIYDEFKIDFQVFLDSDNSEGNEFDLLCERYREKLTEIEVDFDLLANYGIKVAYRSISEDKLLCWTLFGDNMIRNIKNNTPNKINYKIVESNKYDSKSKEFLGRYYTLVEE